MTPGIVRWRQKASARIFCPVPETSCTWICVLWTAHCQHFSFREIWAFILLERMELSCTISRKNWWNSSGEARKRWIESIFTAFYTAFFSTVFQRRMKKEILLWMSSTGILHVTLQWKISLTGFIWNVCISRHLWWRGRRWSWYWKRER